MGLWEARNRRRAERERRTYDAAYDKAIANGKTPEEAAMKADSAVRRLRRRRMVAVIGAVTGGR